MYRERVYYGVSELLMCFCVKVFLLDDVICVVFFKLYKFNSLWWIYLWRFYREIVVDVICFCEKFRNCVFVKYILWCLYFNWRKVWCRIGGFYFMFLCGVRVLGECWCYKCWVGEIIVER